MTNEEQERLLHHAQLWQQNLVRVHNVAVCFPLCFGECLNLLRPRLCLPLPLPLPLFKGARRAAAFAGAYVLSSLPAPCRSHPSSLHLSPSHTDGATTRGMGDSSTLAGHPAAHRGVSPPTNAHARAEIEMVTHVGWVSFVLCAMCLSFGVSHSLSPAVCLCPSRRGGGLTISRLERDAPARCVRRDGGAEEAGVRGGGIDSVLREFQAIMKSSRAGNARCHTSILTLSHHHTLPSPPPSLLPPPPHPPHPSPLLPPCVPAMSGVATSSTALEVRCSSQSAHVRVDMVMWQSYVNALGTRGIVFFLCFPSECWRGP